MPAFNRGTVFVCVCLLKHAAWYNSSLQAKACCVTYIVCCNTSDVWILTRLVWHLTFGLTSFMIMLLPL